MKEFDKWLERGEPGEGIGRYPRYGTTDEDCAAGEAWRAALEWVKRELPRAEAGFINPDLGLGEILKKELEE